MTVKVVIDTNILVPSLYSKTHILYFILVGNLTVLWNNYIKLEVHDIINRLSPKYIQKYGYRPMDIENMHIACNEIMTPNNYISEMPNIWPSQCKDREDDPFLWVAYAGNADFLITKDRKHLLSLKNFQDIPIGTPAQFFTWAKKNRPIAQ